MKRFKLQLSGFDIGMIIAFVVVTLLGVAGWYYLSMQLLQPAQAQDAEAKKDFDDYSVKGGIIVNNPNIKNLQTNSDLLKQKIDPLISTYLLSKDNKLRTVDREDPVAWKHDLDEDVRALNTQAKAHNIAVPNNFYFGFSRYLTQSPHDEQTAVLTKQRLGITEIANILINEQVKGITAVERTYEEDARPTGGSSGGSHSDPDELSGYSEEAPGKAYTAYPFQIEFESATENLRPVINDLIKSPYIFVVRSIEIHNSSPNSPLTTSLDQLAGTTPGASSVIAAAPGEVAASTPPKGPQYLFGNSYLSVKLRVDMIEWNPSVKNSDPPKHP